MILKMRSDFVRLSLNDICLFVVFVQKDVASIAIF